MVKIYYRKLYHILLSLPAGCQNITIKKTKIYNSGNRANKQRGIYISRIKEEEKRTLILNKIDESKLASEIEGNPLLLNFICMLADEEWNHKEYEIDRELWIKNLNEIHNKEALYENIIKLILYKHEVTKWSDFYSRGDITDTKERIKALHGRYLANSLIFYSRIKRTRKREF